MQGYINIPYTTKIHVLAINPTTTILAKAFLKSSHLVFPEKIKRERGSVPIISLIPWQLPYNLICNFHSKTIDRLPIHVIVKHHTCSTSVAFYPWWIESGNLERISWSFYIEIVTWNKKVLATENLISASPSSGWLTPLYTNTKRWRYFKLFVKLIVFCKSKDIRSRQLLLKSAPIQITRKVTYNQLTESRSVTSVKPVLFYPTRKRSQIVLST